MNNKSLPRFSHNRNLTRIFAAAVLSTGIVAGATYGSDKLLFVSASAGLSPFVGPLVTLGASKDGQNEALAVAALNGRSATVSALLDHGADIHAKGDAALSESAFMGHAITVRLLLDRGANVHANDDLTLQWASMRGHTETVKLLLDRGADIHALDDHALKAAIRYGRTMTVALLEERGASVDSKNAFQSISP